MSKLKKIEIKKRGLSAGELRDLLIYDPDTGIFVWKNLVSKKMKPGQRAGCVKSKRYRHIQIHGRKYAEHRLAWLYMTGDWPELQIDHINRTPDDNRWANLRQATWEQQRANSKGVTAPPFGRRKLLVRNRRQGHIRTCLRPKYATN